MRITRLEAQNIGPFEDLKIDFKEKVIKDKAEIHILTGENGTGKSTVLMMLTTYGDKTNDSEILKRFHSQNFLQSTLDNGKFSSFRIYSDFADSFYSFIPQSRKNLGIINYNFTEKERVILNNHSHPFLGYSSNRDFNIQNKLSIIEKEYSPFDNALNFKKTLQFDDILDWIVINKAKEAFALLRKDNEKAQLYGQAIKSLENLIGQIIEKDIEFIVDDQPLRVWFRIDGKNLDFNILPDGLKSIISWLSDLLMRLDRINWADKSKSILEQNFVLFLDEIEVHLHPSWQRKILPVVQNLFPNAQIFISTHSPFVVGSVDGAWVYKFKLDENNNSVLDKIYESEDGHSYQYYLRTGFDINSDFGIENEKDLNKFMELKDRIIRGEEVNMGDFEEIVNRLENQTGELSSIVGFEKRKLEKYLNKNLTTA